MSHVYYQLRAPAPGRVAWVGRSGVCKLETRAERETESPTHNISIKSESAKPMSSSALSSRSSSLKKAFPDSSLRHSSRAHARACTSARVPRISQGVSMRISRRDTGYIDDRKKAAHTWTIVEHATSTRGQLWEVDPRRRVAGRRDTVTQTSTVRAAHSTCRPPLGRRDGFCCSSPGAQGGTTSDRQRRARGRCRRDFVLTTSIISLPVPSQRCWVVVSATSRCSISVQEKACTLGCYGPSECPGLQDTRA